MCVCVCGCVCSSMCVWGVEILGLFNNYHGSLRPQVLHKTQRTQETAVVRQECPPKKKNESKRGDVFHLSIPSLTAA